MWLWAGSLDVSEMQKVRSKHLITSRILQEPDSEVALKPSDLMEVAHSVSASSYYAENGPVAGKLGSLAAQLP